MTTPAPSPQPTVSAIRLEIRAPLGERVWSINDDHSKAGRWKVRNRRLAWMRAAVDTCRRAEVPWLGQADLAVTIHLVGWKRADAHNYPAASSLKGAIDGLIPQPSLYWAGVIPDDRQPYLLMTMPVLAPADGSRSQKVRHGPPRIIFELTPRGSG